VTEPKKPPAKPDEQALTRYDFMEAIETQASTPGAALTALDFEPRNLDGLLRIAELVSKIPIAPKIYQGQPNIALMVMWKGRERGLPVMRSLELIYPFISEKKGPQVAYAADLLYGLVERSGACEYFLLVESTADHATYRTQRRGQPEPEELTYSLADAKLADLLGKENWIKHPAAMCRAACKRNLARAVYGDVLAGLYTREEIQEAEAIDVTPEPAKPVAIEAGAQKAIDRAKRGSRRLKGEAPTQRAVSPGSAEALAYERQVAEQAAPDPPTQTRAAVDLAPLSREQADALLARAAETNFQAEGEVAFRVYVATRYNRRLELQPAALYEELLAAIEQDAAVRQAAREEVPDAP
jgi:hypothetical protein